MGVSTRTIRRWLDYLEEKGALVRIPVAGKVCAYALDPHEVWKGYNTTKNHAAFVTKTLVNKDGDIQRRIMAMFSNVSQRQADNQGLRVNVLTMIVYPTLLFCRLKIPCVFLLPDLQNDRAATVPAAP